MPGASSYPMRPAGPAHNWDETSGADLSGKEGYGVGSSSKSVTLAATSAAFSGVLIDGGVASGDAVGYITRGRVHAICNGNSPNIAVGDPVKLMAGGIFVKAADANDEYVGRAEEVCDGDGEFILIDLDFKGHVGPGGLGLYTLHTEIADPGDAAAIPVTASGIVKITTAAAETNTLAIPTFEGQLLALMCEVYAVGDRVVTVASAVNQTGNNTITLGAAQDFIVLIAVAIGATLYWRVYSNDGAGLSTV